MAGSRGWVLVALALALGACGGEKRKTTVQPERPRAHRTFSLASDGALDTAIGVRDMLTAEQFMLEDRGGLMVLRTSAGAIDTITTPASRSSGRRLELLDSSIVRLASEPDAGADADILAVVDGRLTWAARLPQRRHISDSAAYSASMLYRDAPRSLAGAESFTGAVGSVTQGEWRSSFDLRFDDSSRVFFNTSIRLDSVPRDDGRPFIHGYRPGIALKLRTIVYDDGRWYALSSLEDLDLEELARGTVGLVLSGKAEWADTLRVIR
jgi:hypothetical protein